MPNTDSKVRENLEGQLEKLRALDEETKRKIIGYEKIVKSLEKLNNLTDEQYKLDRGTYKNMEAEDYKAFHEAYAEAAEACNGFLTAAGQDPQFKAPAEIIGQISSYLADDMNALMEGESKKQPMTFQMIMDNARTLHLNIGDQDLGSVGAAMSSRIPFKYVQPNGQEISGVFTKKKIFDIDEEIAQAGKIKDTISYAGEEKAGEIQAIFEEFYPAYKKAHPGMENEDVERHFHETIKKINSFPNSAMQAHKLASSMEKVFRAVGKDDAFMDRFDELVQDKDFEIASAQFIDNLASRRGILNSVGVNLENAKISDKSRIDSRNSAMSTVANLLGKPELLAHSVPMKITYKGQEIEGTFMALGKGMDYDHPTQAAKQYTARNMQTNGLASVSDLMVLDYICGNTDRHAGNMLYQFNSSDPMPVYHKFTGVQGIDNDCSFGDFVPKDRTEGRVWMTSIDDLQVMSKSMADKVKSLTPEMLKYSLRNADLTEKQLNAAGERLKLMKQAVTEGEQFYGKHKVDFKDAIRPSYGHLLVVPDEAFQRVDFRLLSDKVESRRHMNDYKILTELPQAFKQASAGKKGLDPKQVNEKQGFSLSSEDLRQVDADLQKLADVTKQSRGTSEQFEQVRQTLTNYREFVAAHENTMLSAADYKMYRSYLKQISQDSSAYLDYKGVNKLHKHYARSRINAVHEIGTRYYKTFKAAKPASELYQQVAAFDENGRRIGADEAHHDVRQEFEERGYAEMNARLRAQLKKADDTVRKNSGASADNASKNNAPAMDVPKKTNPSLHM